MIGVSTTTAQLRGAIPWESPLPLGLTRVPVGIDIHTGSAFCFDPFQAYQRGIVTDPSDAGPRLEGLRQVDACEKPRRADGGTRLSDPTHRSQRRGPRASGILRRRTGTAGSSGHQSLRRTLDRRPGDEWVLPCSVPP